MRNDLFIVGMFAIGFVSSIWIVILSLVLNLDIRYDKTTSYVEINKGCPRVVMKVERCESDLFMGLPVKRTLVCDGVEREQIE